MYRVAHSAYLSELLLELGIMFQRMHEMVGKVGV